MSYFSFASFKYIYIFFLFIFFLCECPRCFPMVTDRITRSNSFYRSYISASAACFATVCKDGQVYIRIPAAADQEARDIACPEGEIVDLALEGIGYLEGKVGPCPSSVSLCASHG